MSRSASIADARRSVRCWASSALALLLAATMIQLESPGPGLVLSGLAGTVAILLALRHPRPAEATADRASRINAAARLALLVGLAIAIAAFALSRIGEDRARIAALCEGQSTQMEGWKLTLNAIAPAAGNGFTALQASLAAQRGDAPPLMLKPQLRSWFTPAPAAAAPGRMHLWDGDLILRFAGYDAPKGCITLEASWRPFAGLVRIGGWLAALGAAAMALVAFGSLLWRSKARERIAMRREERPLPGPPPARASNRSIPAVGKVLVGFAILGLTGYLALGRAEWPSQPAVPASPRFEGGAALVSARQSLLDGPANLNRWIVIADAMARRGRFGDAAEVLLGAVESSPGDPQGWLALGDALFAHSGGRGLNGAASFAYDRADRASIRAGKAPLLVAELFLRSGRQDMAREWLERRIREAALNAPWRAELEQRLAATESSPSGQSTAAPAP